MNSLHRLNFQHLLYLQALVEERHVTRAAERMNIGQPAMSSALAKLRVIFRDVLLVKTSSGMEPTPRALELVAKIGEMADLLEGRGCANAQFDPAQSQTRWRIIASDGIVRAMLPELMATTGREAPNMRFTVQPGDPRRLSEYLRDGDFDLAMGFVRSPPSELRQTMLYPQRVVCIARSGHPKIRGSLSLQQFEACDHVRWGAPPVAHATMEVTVDEALEKLGMSRRVALMVSSLNLLPGVVEKSDLLAVVPLHLALQSRETLSIQIHPVPFPLPEINVSMLWHERMHQDSAHKWLREQLHRIGQSLSARVQC